MFLNGGRATEWVGMVFPTPSNQTPNAVKSELESQKVGAKLHFQKGNSPDRSLRSLIYAKCK